MKRVIPYTLGIAVVMAAMSFIVPANKIVTIRFKNFVGSNPLVLDSVSYKNNLGQPFTVSKFKYYVGCICLQKKDGGKYQSQQYFLVNEEEDESKQIVLNNVPEGDYTTLSFIIGVDSLNNCNGAQSGALDPIKGMYWTWNTGYIFLKMEGKSPLSKSPGNLLEFHIGGYKQPANCIRTIKLDISKTTNEIDIKADLAQLFKSHTDIDFTKTSSVTDFHGATTIADNYADMFSVIHE